jgi:putative PIN family toxin of toxin-antitoxin system
VRKRIALSDEELDRFVQALRFTAEIVATANVVVQVPGDRDDDAILATLIGAKADWLVTGDSALLALSDRYPVVTPAQFAARHLR